MERAEEKIVVTMKRKRLAELLKAEEERDYDKAMNLNEIYYSRSSSSISNSVPRRSLIYRLFINLTKGLK